MMKAAPKLGSQESLDLQRVNGDLLAQPGENLKM